MNSVGKKEIKNTTKDDTTVEPQKKHVESRQKVELEKSETLRNQAERLIKDQIVDLQKLSTKDVQFLIHELQVHQIELEIQNEDLRRTQIELEESRNRYSNLYDFSPVGYFTFDKNGLIIEVNLTGANKLGIERQFLIKQPFSIYITPDNRNMFYKHIRDVFRNGSRQTCELELVEKSGNKFYAQLESLADGPSLFRTAISDITENKKAQEVLRKAHDELEIMVNERTAELAHSNAELEQFAYIASHHLQEPLRTISSFTQLLAMRYKDKIDKEADKFIYHIVDGASRMQRMIEDMLEYSRVDVTKKTFEPTDFEDVFMQVMTNLKIAIEQNGAIVAHDPLPVVMADETQMIQLFQNLLSNAIKFRGKDAPHIHVSALKKGNDWVFSVKDNGIGISPKFFGHIFQLFQRNHSRSEYSGTGIGLAICRKIVERHGGNIWVESEVGKGSTFYFTVPAT